ncbi:MAG: HAMP domain-containing sensor histidine kinase [bacterium]
MIRRLLPLLVAVGLGVAATYTGLFLLHRTFQAERAAALGELAARRQALEQYARAALARTLAQRMQALGPRLRAAATDPWPPGPTCCSGRAGRSGCPGCSAPPWRGDPGPHALRGAGGGCPPPTPDQDDPWAERLERRAALFAALDAGDRGPSRPAFAASWRRSRATSCQPSRMCRTCWRCSIASSAGADPTRRCSGSSCTTASPTARGRIESVQRRLLQRREAFTVKDFEFLAAETRRLGAGAGVPDADFVARAAEGGPALAAEVDEPTILPGGFYAEPAPGGAQGFRVAPGPLLQELTQEMRARSLLTTEERVEGELAGLVAAIGLRVESPVWARAHAAADAAYWQKSLLLALCAVLVAGVAALAVAGQHRKQRYLSLKSDFVSAVSHELRTPLASIRLMAETLERRLAGEARARDYPTRIVGAVDGLALMVENILSFNRLDRGRWVARREAMALADVLDRARDKVVPHAPRPVRWAVEGAEGVSLRADPELIELLIVNLARNAVQYTERPEAQVTLTATVGATRGRGLSLAVADNGRGMSPAVIKHVFTPFYRAPESAGSRGSGLGLALCQRIMALHGGRLSVTRSSPEGTVFTLEFPPEAVL